MPVLTSLLAAVLCACAGPGTDTVAGAGPAGAATKAKARSGQGDRLLVRLYDSRHDLRLELANESHPDLADSYSELRKSATLKLAPDTLMGELLTDLDAIGFAQFSAEGLPPEGARAADAPRGWVEVQHGATTRTFVVPATAPSAEQLTAFTHMKLVINEYYTHLGALQYIDNPQGADIFRAKGS